MNYFIKEHKGFKIFYDDLIDKFETEIQFTDKFKTSKRTTLIALEKDINDFVKENLGFVPFKVVRVNQDSFDIINIRAIRTDGMYVRDSYSGTSLVSPELIGTYYNYDENFVIKSNELINIKKELKIKHKTIKLEFLKDLKLFNNDKV